MAPSLPHFVTILKRDAQRVMQKVDAVIYRQGPWLAVEGDLYKLENYREISEWNFAAEAPTPTISLAIVTGFNYAEHYVYPAESPAREVFWISNFDAELDGNSSLRLVTSKLVTIQRWALRYITAKRVKSLKTRLTIAMSLHGRLGAASPIRGFDSDVMQMIFVAL